MKRAVARKIFAALTGKCTVPQYDDLRPARRAKNITLTTAASALNVSPARIGELELADDATRTSPPPTAPGSTRLDSAQSISPSKWPPPQ